VKTLRILTIVPLVVIVAGLVAGAASAGNDWHGTKATVSSGESRSTLRLWERGPDVVLTYEVAGLVTDQTRCENGVLTDFDVAHNAAVVHADMSGADCTRIASDPLRGPGRAARSGKFKATSGAATEQGPKRTTYVSDAPNLPVIVLDDATSLPVSVSYGGQAVAFAYEQIDSPAPPAPPTIALNASTASTYVEEYRSARAADIAAAFKVEGLPGQLGGFKLDKLFTYDSGSTTGRAYYAIWRDQSGRELQVVLNTRVATGSSPYGFTDDGEQVSFRVFEGDLCLQVFAPDLSSLRAAVAAVRPELTTQLEQEIAHPTTPPS
jgi:hypothetical protein